MEIKALLAILLVVTALGGCLSNANVAPVSDSMGDQNVSLRGFNFGAWDRGGWDATLPIEEGLQFAADEGANFIAMDWPVCFEDDGHMVSDGGTLHPPLSDIEAVIGKAKAKGLYVMLKPHVTMSDVPQNRNFYNTDTKKFLASVFFRDWKAYLVRLVEVANRMNVDGICIGTEMNCLDWMHRTEWLDIVSTLRHSYQGDLTYDAVFTVWHEVKGIHDVAFWDVLDFIGCSLYVPITRDDNASVSEIMEGWTNNQVGTIRNIPKYLQDISRRYNKQIMVLEGGYQSVSGGLFRVNDPPNETKLVNYDLQSRGLTAYLAVLYNSKGAWLKGISLWQISPITMTPSELSKMWHTQEFTVYKKPAAEVVKGYFMR